MKKIFANLLFISSLLFLTGCSLFSGEKQEQRQKIAIPSATLNYNYSSFSISFLENENATYYTVYFTGEENVSMSRIKPSVVYDLPLTRDGDYNVFLKAFASYGYEDSDLYSLGTLSKVKIEKQNSIQLSLFLKEDYSIEVNALNTIEDDESPFEIVLYKDNKPFLTEKNCVKEGILKTDSNLLVGTYSASAFFPETKNEKASEEIFYPENIMIGQRQLEVKNFKAVAAINDFELTWEESKEPTKRILIVNDNGNITTYENSFQNKTIKSGLIIHIDDLSKTNYSFALKIIDEENSDTFLDSAETPAEVIFHTLRKIAPKFEVTFDEYSGNIKITSSETVDSSLYYRFKRENEENASFVVFPYEKFPVSINLKNKGLSVGINYVIEMFRKGESSLYDSEIISKKIRTNSLTPNCSFATYDNCVNVMNNDLKTYEYTVRRQWYGTLTNLGDSGEAIIKSFTSNSRTITFDNLSMLPRGTYTLEISFPQSYLINSENYVYSLSKELYRYNLTSTSFDEKINQSDALLGNFNYEIQETSQTHRRLIITISNYQLALVTHEITLYFHYRDNASGYNKNPTYYFVNSCVHKFVCEYMYDENVSNIEIFQLSYFVANPTGYKCSQHYNVNYW